MPKDGLLTSNDTLGAPYNRALGPTGYYQLVNDGVAYFVIIHLDGATTTLVYYAAENDYSILKRLGQLGIKGNAKTAKLRDY